MRSTGSREQRERRDASATSPLSIAVNTFSMRFGSRRIQRPSHQKMRSITTATAMIDTIKIGHMIGPPLRKLSMRKFVQPDFCGCVVTAGDAAGLSVAETAGLGSAPVAPGEVSAPGAAGDVIAPGAGDVMAPVVAPGAAGDIPVAVGGTPGAAGVV